MNTVAKSFGAWIVADKFLLAPLCQKFSSRFRSLGSDEQLRYKSYVASLVHATLLTGWTVKKHLEMMQSKPWTKEELEKESKEGLEVSAYFLGELLYDSFTTFEIIKNRPAELFHHTLGICAFGLLLYKRLGGSMIKQLMTIEISTVFMDLLWLLNPKGALHKFLAIGFVSSFFLTRVASYPFNVKSWIEKDPEMKALWKAPLFKGIVVGMWLLQTFWFTQIAANAYQTLMGKRKK